MNFVLFAFSLEPYTDADLRAIATTLDEEDVDLLRDD